MFRPNPARNFAVVNSSSPFHEIDSNSETLTALSRAKTNPDPLELDNQNYVVVQL